MTVALHDPPPRTQTPGEPYRLSVDQYQQMVEYGILTEADRVELLEGRIVTKMTKNPPHVVATDLLQAALARLVPAGWFLSMQNPVTTEDSEPEPDARIVRGSPRDYRERHPGQGDVALVVEVSDSSLPIDREVKQRIYARAGIPVYWIVNLPERRLEVYTAPTGVPDAPDYGTRSEYGPEDEVELVIGGQAVGRIAVRDLLP